MMRSVTNHWHDKGPKPIRKNDEDNFIDPADSKPDEKDNFLTGDDVAEDFGGDGFSDF